MRLWILSDLHIESCRWKLPDPRPEYDVLIAAGDIFTPASSGVDWLSRRARGKPVIYVPGNHEWYSPNHLNNVAQETERAELLAAERGIHWLNEGAVMIDGVRFLGATLWTDYRLYE
ncbi:MAG: metallophosphoesterase [Hyphomonadaceae bacterium]|jgi:predicted phosphodiesterase